MKALESLSKKLISKKHEDEYTKKFQAENAKEKLAMQFLVVLTTAFPSEDRRLAQGETFDLLKNLIKLEFKGLPKAQIRYGISRVSSQKWPPTPFEFRRLCRPDPTDFGLVPLDTALYTLQRRVTDKNFYLSESMTFVYQNCDSALLMDFKRQSEAERQVDYFYNVCCDRLMSNQSLDPVAPAVLDHLTAVKIEEPVTRSDVVKAMRRLGLSNAIQTFKERGK